MNRRPYVSDADKKKMWQEKLKPVSCNNLNDIKMIISSLMDSGDEIMVSCTIGDEKVSGKSTSSSLHRVLLEGMNMVKSRMDAMKKMSAAIIEAEKAGVNTNMQLWDISKVRFNVDSLIEKRLGGKRNGTRIRWVVKDGTYEYDPFSSKLYEVEE